MKTAYAAIERTEVMRAPRKGQVPAFCYGDLMNEMRWMSSVFEKQNLLAI